MTQIRLSPSSLSTYRDCPKCFWLEKVRGIKRPRGVFPSLPGGMDAVIKAYFDRCRARHILPPEIRDKVEGSLFDDIALLEKWRNWRKGLSYEMKEIGATLSGAIDDCVVKGDLYIPLDYKTHGYGPKEGHGEEYYQHQLDCYALLLEKNGRRAADFAYLVYYVPKEVRENGVVIFGCEVQRIMTHKENAESLVREAVGCLRGKMPDTSPTCEYCSWVKQQKGKLLDVPNLICDER